jgi:hypothetical protein
MTPDFRELVGEEGTPDERERLQRVHDLLVAAGPPPELSPALESPPSAGSAEVRWLPRRRRQALVLVAAAVIAVAFGVGYLVGNNGSSAPKTSRMVGMHGVGRLASATGAVRIGERDEYGNWPLVFTVRGLRRLPKGSWYVLYLTRHGKRVAPCGTFNADGGETTVRLSVPYDLERYNGWVVTARRHGKEGGTLLRTLAI